MNHRIIGAGSIALALGLALPAMALEKLPLDASVKQIVAALTPDDDICLDCTRGVGPASARPQMPEEKSAYMNIRFALGSAELDVAARHAIDRLGEALASEELKDFRFQIEGHTDATGSADLNQNLSERRASAVRNYIVRKFAVAPSRLAAMGKGAYEPLPSLDPRAAENRRVQIITRN